MERISFINDKFLPHSKCLVHIEDRGFQFADGIYEVVLFKNNKLIDLDWHLNRLFSSLSKVEIKFNKTRKELTEIMLELFSKNNLAEGSVYLQITRGVAPRQQYLPKECSPTITATVSSLSIVQPKNFESGFSAITCEDIRWHRCDIKSISLMASSWTRQKAFDQGADEAIFVRNGFITEATFANVFMVDQNNNLITREADNEILCGITRNRLISLARENSINVLEKKFTVEEMLQASEVFVSSSTLLIRSISKINQQKIGSGKAGEISQKLLNLYNKFILS